ncbi:MAG TPA: DNA mismatch repair endonuclease MutL, partial [Myxococcota bacterium]|nr:DNA mismatch repair endonuclease MutL [Myxococcota bacterium]
MSVRILEDRVVDRIAAGEVVERPASVVKELVENALDAGARRVHVRLKHGGVGLVQVTDDGCGMSRDDAMLCVERHATSKILTADDLVGVATHGFRGEALPSIGSVARLELRTRRADDEVGTEVVVDGGVLTGVRAVACPVGTEVSVRSLFSHTPARRKFLKSAQVELDHAIEAVRRAILRRPEVEVLVAHEARELLRAAATEDPAVRVRDVLGTDAAVLIPVDERRGDVRVDGLMAPPGVHRGSSTGAVYVYVNGRFVRDTVLRRAIGEAWRGAIPAGRFPVLVIGVEVPAEDVDVNVHPQKTEV